MFFCRLRKKEIVWGSLICYLANYVFSLFATKARKGERRCLAGNDLIARLCCSLHAKVSVPFIITGNEHAPVSEG